jgi:hypothetical protein
MIDTLKTPSLETNKTTTSPSLKRQIKILVDGMRGVKQLNFDAIIMAMAEYSF